MSVNLSFLDAVAIAGVAYLIGEVIVRRFRLLRHYFIPEPAIGALIVAIIVLLLHVGGVNATWPTSGYPVDFLSGLLTANMGLHVTWKLLRSEGILFLIFLAAGIVLYFLQLGLSYPIALFADPHTMQTAIVGGPLSVAGAPFNLNPPTQVPPSLGSALHPAFPTVPSVKALAQGVMMISVVIGIFLSGFVGRHLFQRAGQLPPRPDPDDRHFTDNVWALTTAEVGLVALIFSLDAASFAVQKGLLDLFPGLTKNILPQIVIAFLLGVLVRLIWDAILRKPKQEFPKKALTILLLGPTMGIILTYSLMSIPLYNLRLISWPLVVMALLAIVGSVAIAWLSFPIFARVAGRYYGAVISTVFLAITTAWGPLGMAYMRRFTDEEGPIPPMPLALPLNAFWLIPWAVLLSSKLMLHLF